MEPEQVGETPETPEEETEEEEVSEEELVAYLKSGPGVPFSRHDDETLQSEFDIGPAIPIMTSKGRKVLKHIDEPNPSTEGVLTQSEK